MEKQVSAVSKLLTDRNYIEIVGKCHDEACPAQQKRTVQGYHGQLLSWRWESLHVTLKHHLEVRSVLLLRKIHFILPMCIGLTCSPASSRSGPIGLKGFFLP